MNPLPSFPSLRGKIIFFQLLLLAGCLLFLPREASAQKKQLTPSDKVKKIALVDHSRLRKEYKGLADALQKLSHEGRARQKAFDESLGSLAEQERKQLKADSVRGGKKQGKIASDISARRSTLMSAYLSAMKRKNEEKINLMREYERKITLAIDAVVAEGGFTEVRQATKETPKERSVDVTDLILKKLN